MWPPSDETFVKVTIIRSSDVSVLLFNKNLESAGEEDDSEEEPQRGSDLQHRRRRTTRLRDGGRRGGRERWREKFCPNNTVQITSAGKSVMRGNAQE